MQFIGKDIQAIIFDHDDTLVGTIDAKWAAHKYNAKTHYNKVLTDNEIRLHWGKPLRALVSLLYGAENSERAMAHEIASQVDFPKLLLDDTISVLEHFHKAGKKLGVITATSRQSFNHDLGVLGIPAALFDFTQTEEDTEYHKPDPRVFKPAEEWLKINKIDFNDVVYVGDGFHDMEAALGAGFQFIGVGTGLITPKEFHKRGAKAVKKLADLIVVEK